jgi:hypothetical protein
LKSGEEIEARYEEADQLRGRAVERAQIEADLAQRRFMLVDPNNRLVGDTLEREWNNRLRALADAREEREHARRRDQVVLDDAICQQLVTMTADFRRLWDDPRTANRERKRLLGYIIEDATLVKVPAEQIQSPRAFQRWQNRNAHGAEPQVICTTNPDIYRSCPLS